MAMGIEAFVLSTYDLGAHSTRGRLPLFRGKHLSWSASKVVIAAGSSEDANWEIPCEIP